MQLRPLYRSNMQRFGAILALNGAVWLGGFGIFSAPAPAQAPNSESAAQRLAPEDALFEQLLDTPSTYDLGNVDFRESSEVDRNWGVVDEEETSLYEATLPNFWWSRDDLPTLWRAGGNTTVRIAGGYRLVRNWLAFRSTTADAAIVDVQVDPQYWRRFNDFQKYAILTRMGRNGMNYGYHVRLYSSVRLEGVHACDFSSVRAFIGSPDSQIPISQLENVSCAVALGPFIDFSNPEFGGDLFSPP